MKRAALSIANAKGLPGSAGMMIENAQGKRCLLTNHHVVFGGGAVTHDPVWALPPDYDGGSRVHAVFLGRGLTGRIGRVSVAEGTCFVDCALVQIGDETTFPPWLAAEIANSSVVGIGDAEVGLPVEKYGATTGFTTGSIVDAAYVDHPYVGGRWWSAPGQLLVDPFDPELNFSGPGDSGATLLDEQGRAIGLLWGTNANGQGIACPIRAVLECLGLALPTPTARPSMEGLS